MASTQQDSVIAASNQVGGRHQKRKSTDSQDSNSEKRQKPEGQRPRTRSQEKKLAMSDQPTNAAGGVADNVDMSEQDRPSPSDVLLATSAGQPPVSSNVRAALCDSIDYWKAHQGGIQSVKKVATGMLLNGQTTPRDILQAQVIITTVYV